MTARLVLPGTAPEEEWLAARRKGVTASEIAVVMGLSPFDSPYALWHRKRGDLPGQEDNNAMTLGRYLEQFVIERFMERRPELVAGPDSRDLFAHAERSWQLCTPDALVWESAGEPEGRYAINDCDPFAVLEAKTSATYDGWGDDGSDDIPVHYRCQVLWQMDVLGVTSGFAACLFLPSGQLRVYELQMDSQAERDLELMRDEAYAFLMRDEPPDVDWRPATSKALRQLHPDVEDREAVIGRQLAISYRAAVRRCREAERRRDLLANRILAKAGNARRITEACTGQPVATRSVANPKRIDVGLLRALYPKTAAAVTKVSAPQVRLIPAKPPEEHTP